MNWKYSIHQFNHTIIIVSPWFLNFINARTIFFSKVYLKIWSDYKIVSTYLRIVIKTNKNNIFNWFSIVNSILQSNEVLYKNAMNKALDFLAKSLSPELDAYSLALLSCALAAARHPQATQALQIMDKYANTSG